VAACVCLCVWGFWCLCVSLCVYLRVCMSMSVCDLAIKEETFAFYNPYDDEDVARLRQWMGKIQEFSNKKGVVWTAPTISTKGPYPYERLGNAYDLVKQIKQFIDPNNILNPGALV